MAEPAHRTMEAAVVHTRGYQQELLQESLRRNIVIALETGSGKTHIAMLRMKHEVEQQTKKISWFLAPTVELIKQQRDVIAEAIPVPVGLVSGASEPDQWKDAALWTKILGTYRIMVSTPQILLDALRHGYIHMGKDISLLVFDEAHHAADKHPYNMIMKSFYMPLPPTANASSDISVRPAILGLTASPIYGGDLRKSFRLIEENLDCVIRSSRFNRDELATFVHRPVFKRAMYTSLEFDGITPPGNLSALRGVFEHLDIEDDPYVVSLRSQLAKLQPGEQRNRVDQKLSKTLLNKDTYTHKSLRSIVSTAIALYIELGIWAAEWYVWKSTQQVKEDEALHTGVMAGWQSKEKNYLLRVISRIAVSPVSHRPEDIVAGLSNKVHVLIACLKDEERKFRLEGDVYSGLIFVTTRAAVITLTEILSHLPDMQEHFKVGYVLGASSSVKRNTGLDITRDIAAQSRNTQTLKDFRTGDKNVVIATSVAEEGLDIQACGNVIRFNPPDNMVSWAQSRGRARRQRSTYVVMLEYQSAALLKLLEWEKKEQDMIALYTDVGREQDEGDSAELEDPIQFVVESTGAFLTLDSAMSHIHHFCAVLPHIGQGQQQPMFDLDPPDMEEGWHSLNPRPGQVPYQGPWGATCILPRQVPPELRVFSTSVVYPSKGSARNHAAFFAYHRLYQAGLLNDNLLPLTSVIEPDEDGAVKLLLAEVEQRAGLANVPLQLDPWAIPRGEGRWWYNEMSIEGLPALYIFTRRPLPEFGPDELPVLYVPGKGRLEVRICSGSAEIEEEGVIAAALEYTHRMFSTLHGPRMDESKNDFCYALLPAADSPNDIQWKERRQWQKRRLQIVTPSRLENARRANVEIFSQEFGFPLNVALVRSNDKFQKVLQFIGWHYGPITSEEEQDLQEKYEGFPDADITFPLLLAQAFPRRMNFLIPLESDSDGLGHESPILLHPKHATIDLVSSDEVQLAFQLPSTLRFLAFAITVRDMRTNLFASSERLSSIPFNLLRTALTAPVAQEAVNYQRLETLGDTVLKYMVSLQLFSLYPLWHEGYLSRRKDHAINNSRLAKEAIRLGLEKWIIRDRFVPRKWRPRYVDESSLGPKRPQESVKEAQPDEGDVDEDAKDGSTQDSKPPRRKKKRTQQLSTKMLADVVEALIGAAYEHGGYDLAIECGQRFDLGLSRWERIPDCISTILTRVQYVDDLPPQLALVEKMIGYQFVHPILLAEALTHASYSGGVVDTISYERLEFLGDAALDMIVTDYCYHAEGKNYGPGHMHIRKESLVNSHLLAYLCMKACVVIDASMPMWTEKDGVFLTADSQRIHLHQCLLHSSPLVLDDLYVTFTRYEKNGDGIQLALERDAIYPWAALTSLQAPKFISDILESILGAVLIDSHGNLDAVRSVLTALGHTQIMTRIVNEDVDVLHPVSRLAIWADKNERKWEIKTEKLDGDVSCVVLIDGVEEFTATERYRGKASQNEVRFAAAEGAIRRLQVIEQEEPEDADEVEWGDVPEYDI